MSVVHVTADTFEKEVLQSERTVLLDFWAAWCGPCRMIAPALEEIAEENPDIKVCKVDVDQEALLAAQFQVFSIPTLLVFRNGQQVNKAVGAMPKDDLLGLCE